MALCEITWQLALLAQAPLHGSRHFSCLQALLLGQSGLTKHSGLQFGGTPTYPILQIHPAVLPYLTAQSE